MLTAEFPADAKSIADLKKATADHTVSSILIKTVVDGWPDSRKDCHPLILDYWNFRDEMSVENGLLFKGYRLIVPKNLRNQVLQIVHKGHFGIEKMQLRARKTVLWPGINKAIVEIAPRLVKFVRSPDRN